MTLIREDIWREIQQKVGELRKSVRAVVTANGDKLELTGQCIVRLEVGGLVAEHEVLVAKSLTQECLLGADFLGHNGCLIDLKRRVLYAGGAAVCLHGSGDDVDTAVCLISMADTVSIPPSCRMHLRVKVCSQPGNQQDDLLIEPLQIFMDKHDLIVACSLSKASSKYTVVQVLNHTAEDVVVHEDEAVGLARPVHRVLCGAMREDLPGGDYEKICEVMLQDAKLTMNEKEAVRTLLVDFEDVFAKHDTDLGRTNLVYHKMHTRDHLPIRQHARRLALDWGKSDL